MDDDINNFFWANNEVSLISPERMMVAGVLLGGRIVIFSKRMNESRRGIAISRLATAKLYLASVWNASGRNV